MINVHILNENIIKVNIKNIVRYLLKYLLEVEVIYILL